MPKATITRGPSAKAAAKASTAIAPTTPAKAPKAAKAKPEAKAAKPAASVTRGEAFAKLAEHSLYAGPSLNFNRSRSTTPIKARDVASYTYRLDCQLRELIGLYGAKPFSRGQHGDVNRLLGNAGIASLNSDGTLTLTASAIRAANKLKPLALGDSIPLASFHDAGKAAKA